MLTLVKCGRLILRLRQIKIKLSWLLGAMYCSANANTFFGENQIRQIFRQHCVLYKFTCLLIYLSQAYIE